MKNIIKLGGKEYRLNFSIKTLQKLEDDLKIPYLRIGEYLMSEKGTVDTLLKVLWYGIGGEASGLTLEELTNELEKSNMKPIPLFQKVLSVLADDLGLAEISEAKEGVAPFSKPQRKR